MKRKRSRRERLEDAIEKAIALLDAIDGDPDLEPDFDNEPDYRDRKPPKGYMHAEDLVSVLCPSMGVKHGGETMIFVLRIWLANRLLDLGLIGAATA